MNEDVFGNWLFFTVYMREFAVEEIVVLAIAEYCLEIVKILFKDDMMQTLEMNQLMMTPFFKHSDRWLLTEFISKSFFSGLSPNASSTANAIAKVSQSTPLLDVERIRCWWVAVFYCVAGAGMFDRLSSFFVDPLAKES